MEDFNQKATKEIADMIHYVAEDVVKSAPYDVTRNGRITKVYKDINTHAILGYDIMVDGRPYHFDKDRGKGIIAKENDIVQVHFPCNNSNYMYLTYAHDPEDSISELNMIVPDNYMATYYSGIKHYQQTYYFSSATPITFPTTTKQFSYFDLTFGTTFPQEYMYLPWSDVDWKIYPTTDNGTWCVILSRFGQIVDGAHPLVLRIYNENPTTTSPVTKELCLNIMAYGSVGVGNIF